MIGQQRLCQVQLVNWGTFDGARSFTVPREGLLLTGPSGSGKSSLLDALAAILVRPSRLRFNAAAQGTDTGDRDRSLVTYVRGAHKRQADTETGEIQTAFLRPGATWSGIGLTFDDGRGGYTTLIRLFHIARSTNDASDLKSVFIMAGERVDLLGLQPYVHNGLEQRRIKQGFPAWDVYSNEAYTSFSAKFRRRLGITSEQAQVLLHKTQSAKNLTSLDSLFREFMLDEPQSFQLADETVEQFTELSTAHGAVVDARRQVDALRPLRAHHEELTRLGRQLAEVGALDEHLGAWVDGNQLAHSRTKRAATQLGVDRLADEVRAAETAKAATDRAAVEAQRAYDGAGGAELETLRSLSESHQADLSRRQAQVAQLAGSAAAEGLVLPASAGEVAAFTHRVAELQTGLAEVAKGLKAAEWQTHARRSQASDLAEQIAKELEALRRHRSNLDGRLLEVRTLLAERLQVDETTLPFVGELLEVRPGQDAWRGAIERVLGSFARTLVVPEAHYLAAAEIIDRENLRTRLAYEKVATGRDAFAEAPDDQRVLVHKLILADGPFRGWLWDRLASRYAYACVEGPADFSTAARAVTRRGQVKHNEHSHEKDDRSAVGDRSRWVLGFSTEAKEAELVARWRQASTQRDAAVTALDDHARQAESLQRRRGVLQELQGLSWHDLDLAAAQAKVAELDQRMAGLHRDKPDFATLEAALGVARENVRKAEGVWEGLVRRHSQQGLALEELDRTIRTIEARLAGSVPVPEAVAGALTQLVAQLGTSDRDDAELRKHLASRRGSLEAARNRREREASREMSQYRLGWAPVAADWGDGVEYLPEYLQRLTELEDDGLPAFEDRFFELLQSQARNNISNLAAEIKGARRNVRMRVDEVNKSLLMTQFDRDAYLQIEVRDRKLPQVDAFLATLAEITSGSMTDAFEGVDDRAGAERRFEAMRGLLAKLQSEDPADKSWRRLCLDTRQHVQFQARVQDADRNALDHYTGSGGRSGGERQRLVSFCLAAALRFQLAPPEQAAPSYALVVIDEAFDKADHNFTRAGLEVFRQFGFQLVLATPLKMLQTIEDYVGGVVMVSNESGSNSQLHQLLFEPDAAAPGEVPAPGEVAAEAATVPAQEALL